MLNLFFRDFFHQEISYLSTIYLSRDMDHVNIRPQFKSKAVTEIITVDKSTKIVLEQSIRSVQVVFFMFLFIVDVNIYTHYKLHF